MVAQPVFAVLGVLVLLYAGCTRRTWPVSWTHIAGAVLALALFWPVIVAAFHRR